MSDASALADTLRNSPSVTRTVNRLLRFFEGGTDGLPGLFFFVAIIKVYINQGPLSITFMSFFSQPKFPCEGSQLSPKRPTLHAATAGGAVAGYPSALVRPIDP